MTSRIYLYICFATKVLTYTRITFLSRLLLNINRNFKYFQQIEKNCQDNLKRLRLTTQAPRLTHCFQVLTLLILVGGRRSLNNHRWAGCSLLLYKYCFLCTKVQQTTRSKPQKKVQNRFRNFHKILALPTQSKHKCFRHIATTPTCRLRELNPV